MLYGIAFRMVLGATTVKILLRLKIVSFVSLRTILEFRNLFPFVLHNFTYDLGNILESSVTGPGGSGFSCAKALNGKIKQIKIVNFMIDKKFRLSSMKFGVKLMWHNQEL